MLLLCAVSPAVAETFGADPLPGHCWPEGIISRDDYPYCRLLDANFALHWGIQQQTITFGIFVSGKYSFLGLGLTYGGLTGADIWMARSDDAQPWLANPWHAEDFFSLNATTGPVLDAQQDITLTLVEQTTTYTFVSLQRNLDTCDRDQDFKIFNDTDQLVLFAYGLTYSPSLWQQATGLELQVRLNPMNFNTSNITNTSASYYLEMYADDPPDLQAIALTANNFPIPVNQSHTYRCVDIDIGSYVDSPDANPMALKHHVIRYGGVITSSWFHHVTLFACSQAHPLGARRYGCAGKPPPYCATYYAIWTPSTGNVSLPKEAGLPLGADSYRYFTLILHYVNPSPVPMPPGAKPTVDSSGLVLYMTQQALRPNDAAVLKLGTYTSIPTSTPNGTALTLRSVCRAACTAMAVSGSSVSSAIKMFSTFFRMPSSGSSISTRHTRLDMEALAGGGGINVTEIQPLTQRPHWNASYQWSMSTLPRSRLLLPGDSLITECNMTYNPADPGFAMKDYCQALVMYFPASSFTDCSTYDSGLPTMPTVQACGSAEMVANSTAFNAGVALLVEFYQNFTQLQGITNPQDLDPDELHEALVIATMDKDVLQLSGLMYDGSNSWVLANATPYIEPCEQYVAPRLVPRTAAAIGGIVGVTLALAAFAYFLWARYGQHDDAERQELLQEIRARLQSGSLSDEHFMTNDRS